MEDGSRDATSAGTVTDFLIWVHSSRLQGWDTDFIGYFASALVLAAFLMKSMTTLRVTALISNIAFIAYAISADMRPILILHSLLLPINLFRIKEAISETRRNRKESS